MNRPAHMDESNGWPLVVAIGRAESNMRLSERVARVDGGSKEAGPVHGWVVGHVGDGGVFGVLAQRGHAAESMWSILVCVQVFAVTMC